MAFSGLGAAFLLSLILNIRDLKKKGAPESASL